MSFKVFISSILFLIASIVSFAGQSLVFTENKGQWGSEIKFKAAVPSGNIIFFKDHIVYQQIKKAGNHHHPGHTSKAMDLFTDTNGVSGHVVSIQFLNSLPTIPKGSNAVQAKTHFFYGKRGDFNNVQSYKSVGYRQIYKGIDLNFYESDGVPKYEYIIKAGTSHQSIQMKYDGAEKLVIHEGKLVIKTSIGEIIEQKPIAYQLAKNKKFPIECKYKLTRNILTFEFPKGYNPNFDLVIDPALIFSTYSGSQADNWGNTATYDKYGNMYSGGIVFNDASLPVTSGPFSGFKGGGNDAYILKFDPTGANLLYALYLGGSGREFPRSMIVNSKDELIVLGTTDSPDFPVTNGVIDSTYAGGNGVLTFYNFVGTIYESYPASVFQWWLMPFLGTDIFLSKISFNGDSLLASTFIGGTENDGYQISKEPLTQNYGDQLRGEVIVDDFDNIYFASNTYSSSLPYANGFRTIGSGLSDGLVGKLSSDLKTVFWMNFLGGTNQDNAIGLKVDANSNTFVTGGTNSLDLFSPATGIHPTSQGGIDGYVAKIDPTGQNLLASTYLGTTGYDQSYFLDLDENQNVYVLGQTDGDYPIDTSVYHVANGGQFLHALNNDLDSTIFSTRFGSGSGQPDISLTAFLVNSCAKIYISGWGGTTNEPTDANFFGPGSDYQTGYLGGSTNGLPVTSDAYQSVTDGSDFYFLVLNKNAKSLEYATFFGGIGSVSEHVDGGTSRFDKKGFIYQSVCAGCGGNSGFPSSANAWSRTNNSFNCNNAAVKFDLSTLRAKFETFKTAWTDTGFDAGCADLKILFQNQSRGGTYFKWIWGNGTDTSIVLKDSISYIFTENKKVKVQLVAYDNSTCIESDTASKIIQVGRIAALTADTVICLGKGFYPKLVSIGDTSIQWTPNYAISNPSVKRPFLNPSVTTKYYVTVKDSLGCITTDSADVTVRGYVKAKFESFKPDTTFPGFHEGCVSLSVLFKDSSITSNKFDWQFGNGAKVTTPGTFFLNTYTTSGNYQVRLIVSDTVCQLSDTLSKNIFASLPTATFPSNFIMCSLSSVPLTVVTAPTNTINWSPPLGLSNPNSATTSFYDTLSRTYYLKVNDGLNCTIYDTLTITAKNQVPKARFESYKPDTTQPGYNKGCVKLSVLFKNNSLYQDVTKWDFGNGSVINSQNLYTSTNYITPNIFTVKIFAINTVCGLRDSLAKNITAIQPSANFPTSFINCKLDSVTLKVITSPNNSVSWTPSSGLGNPNAATTKYLGYSDQQYFITVKDLTNCTVGGSLKVTAKNIVPTPNFNIYNLPDSSIYTSAICAPSTFWANNQSQSADQIIWKWPNNNILNRANVNPAFSNEGNYNIKLIAVNTFCNLKDSISKQVRLKIPHVNFPNDTQVCVGTEVLLKVQSNSLKTIEWQPDVNIDNYQSQSPIIKAYMPLGYEIVFLDTNGCEAKDTVLIKNFPVLQPSLLKYLPFCKRETPTISLNPGLFKTYKWSKSGTTDPVLVIDTAGLYKVALSDFNNCLYSDSSKVVQICAPHVYVPSAFSPNGDGKNDQFEVFGSFVTKFDITIFNRWGELIYHTNNFRFKWDGTFRGLDVPIGAYPYVIHYEGSTTEGALVKESLKGDVTVIR